MGAPASPVWPVQQRTNSQTVVMHTCLAFLLGLRGLGDLCSPLTSVSGPRWPPPAEELGVPYLRQQVCAGVLSSGDLSKCPAPSERASSHHCLQTEVYAHGAMEREKKKSSQTYFSKFSTP